MYLTPLHLYTSQHTDTHAHVTPSDHPVSFAHTQKRHSHSLLSVNYLSRITQFISFSLPRTPSLPGKCSHPAHVGPFKH